MEARILTFKRIRLLFCALFLRQLLASLLDFLIPVDDVFLGREKAKTSPSVLATQPRKARKGRGNPRGRPRLVN